MTPLGQTQHRDPRPGWWRTNRTKCHDLRGHLAPRKSLWDEVGRSTSIPPSYPISFPHSPYCTGHSVGWDFSALNEPLPSPSPKWLQLSGPQIGTAGMGLARCPPPSRVCLQERKPAHLWNPSLSPRSASPTCPPGAWGQPPRSVSLFPGPSPITMRVVFTVAQLPLHQPPSCLRAHGLPVLPPPPHGVSYLSKCSGLASWPGLTCHTDPNRRFQMGC